MIILHFQTKSYSFQIYSKNISKLSQISASIFLINIFLYKKSILALAYPASDFSVKIFKLYPLTSQTDELDSILQSISGLSFFADLLPTPKPKPTPKVTAKPVPAHVTTSTGEGMAKRQSVKNMLISIIISCTSSIHSIYSFNLGPVCPIYTDAVSSVTTSRLMRLRLPFTRRRNGVLSRAFSKRYGFVCRVNRGGGRVYPCLFENGFSISAFESLQYLIVILPSVRTTDQHCLHSQRLCMRSVYSQQKLFLVVSLNEITDILTPHHFQNKMVMLQGIIVPRSL